MKSSNYFWNIFLTHFNYGKGSERRKSLHQKSKKEHRKSKSWLIDQNIESIFLNWSERRKIRTSKIWKGSERQKYNLTFDVLILPMASEKIRTWKIEKSNYLWRIAYVFQGLWGVRLGSIGLGKVWLGWVRLGKVRLCSVRLD